MKCIFKYEFPLRRIKSVGYILSFSDGKLLASDIIFGESNSTLLFYVDRIKTDC